MIRACSFPLSRPSEGDALSAFAELRRLDSRRLFADLAWSGRHTIEGTAPIVVRPSNVGLEASGAFCFNARMVCESLAAPSPSRSWFDPGIHKSVAGSGFYKDNPKAALAMRKYIAPQFRPSAAKAIAEHFGAVSIYDPCGGWGDRLVGWLAVPSVQRIHMRDTNPAVFLAYHDICERFSGGRDVTCELVGAESGAPEIEQVDLVMTSPPYYKVEKYAGEASSWKKYGKTFEGWMRGFLRPMIECSWAALRPGGVFAMNIADAYADHRNNVIAQPALEHLLAQPEARLVCVMGYEMRRRVNHRNQFSGVFAEPMLLVSKGASEIGPPRPLSGDLFAESAHA